jgi:hypothetical protein
LPNIVREKIFSNRTRKLTVKHQCGYPRTEETIRTPGNLLPKLNKISNIDQVDEHPTRFRHNHPEIKGYY